MKLIKNEKFEEAYYQEKLDNGLEVIIYHKPEFKTTACAFGTPFGALDLKQSIDGEVKEFHSGLAHFLEHKLFESDQRDITLQFNALGASVNAFTSYDVTVYYFTTTSEDIKTPLNLLLDFVQDFSVTKESVEKEKGIIIQELMMYQQMPEFRLIFESYKALYNSLPLKHDIGGSVEDVKAITKEELEVCYKYNYQPSRMQFVVVSNIEPQVILDMIKDNQNAKEFNQPISVYSEYKEDMLKVVNETVNVEMDVLSPKVALVFKFQSDEVKHSEVIKEEWALQLLMEMTFTSVNNDYQRWLDEGIINSFFGVEVEYGKGYRHLLFYNETSKPEEFKNFIIEQIAKLKDGGISVDLLEQIKRRFYGLAFKVYDDVESIAINHLRYSLDEMEYLSIVDMILNISVQDIKEVLNELDFSNYSLININKIV